MNDRPELDVEYDDQVGAWFGGSRPISPEEIAANVWRFEELPSADFAFIDAVLPGHERTLLGAVGGAPYKKMRSQVPNPGDTTIDFIRAEPGNGAALHSHDVEETFMCLTGRWLVAWGDHGEDSVELRPYDGVVVPPGVMRRFENVSDAEALLLAVVGGEEPGPVVWAESMREPLRAAKPPSEEDE